MQYRRAFCTFSVTFCLVVLAGALARAETPVDNSLKNPFAGNAEAITFGKAIFEATCVDIATRPRERRGVDGVRTCLTVSGNTGAVTARSSTLSPKEYPRPKWWASKASCPMMYCGRSSRIYARPRSARTASRLPRIKGVLRCTLRQAQGERSICDLCGNRSC